MVSVRRGKTIADVAMETDYDELLNEALGMSAPVYWEPDETGRPTAHEIRTWDHKTLASYVQNRMETYSENVRNLALETVEVEGGDDAGGRQ